MRLVLLCGLLFTTLNILAQPGKVTFTSSDRELDAGFTWAKQQALSYVRRNGDPVGDWYEAALPEREAFCMRDVSHQLTGANVLGWQDINKNLLTRFVQSIAASRDWCGFWEIDKLNRPAPVDYRSDEDFWYNLPANFDILDACLRQYQWSGDNTFLNDTSFRDFYFRTVDTYVKTWDKNGDGIMEGTLSKEKPYRGIGSYNEGQDGITGNDLIAAQFRGYLSYADLLRRTGKSTEARRYAERAKKLQSDFNIRWWNIENQSYHQLLTKDSTWLENAPMQLFLLRWGIIPQERARPILINLFSHLDLMNVEMLSYFAHEAFRYGEFSLGIQLLKIQTSPSLKRREYPEVSFGALEAFTEGLMGIRPDGGNRTVSSISRLPYEADTARLEHMPLFDGAISIRHLGTKRSVFTNHCSQPVYWIASFFSTSTSLKVNGVKRTGYFVKDPSQKKCVAIKVWVRAGETAAVSL